MAENSNKTGRGKGKPFEKGKSGNPAGRPKIPKEFKDLAKAHSMEALQTLIRIINDETAKNSDKIRAAEVVFDRAYGKPTQDLNLGGQEDNPLNIEVSIQVID